MTTKKEICKLDNILQKKIMKAKSKKQKGKYKRELTNLHRQWSTLTKEQKTLNRIIAKHRK